MKILRWVLVLPAAILAVIVLEMIFGGLLRGSVRRFLVNTESIVIQTILDSSVTASSLFAATLFGGWVAPDHKEKTILVLCGLFLLISILFTVYSFNQGGIVESIPGLVSTIALGAFGFVVLAYMKDNESKTFI